MKQNEELDGHLHPDDFEKELQLEDKDIRRVLRKCREDNSGAAAVYGQYTFEEVRAICKVSRIAMRTNHYAHMHSKTIKATVLKEPKQQIKSNQLKKFDTKSDPKSPKV